VIIYLKTEAESASEKSRFFKKNPLECGWSPKKKKEVVSLSPLMLCGTTGVVLRSIQTHEVFSVGRI